LIGTYKKTFTIDEKEQWLSHLVPLIAEFMKKGYNPESVFQRLGYGVDNDADGNEHLSPDSYAIQIHRQCCMDLTHPKVMEKLIIPQADAFSVLELFHIEHQEEMHWHQKELESNAAIEADLQANAGRPHDSERGLLQQDEPDIHMEFLASKRGKVIPFINAPKMQSKNDKSFKFTAAATRFFIVRCSICG
jgi:hypothetical protein